MSSCSHNFGPFWPCGGNNVHTAWQSSNGSGEWLQRAFLFFSENWMTNKAEIKRRHCILCYILVISAQLYHSFLSNIMYKIFCTNYLDIREYYTVFVATDIRIHSHELSIYWTTVAWQFHRKFIAHWIRCCSYSKKYWHYVTVQFPMRTFMPACKNWSVNWEECKKCI